MDDSSVDDEVLGKTPSTNRVDPLVALLLMGCGIALLGYALFFGFFWLLASSVDN